MLAAVVREEPQKRACLKPKMHLNLRSVVDKGGEQS